MEKNIRKGSNNTFTEKDDDQYFIYNKKIQIKKENKD